ncbi:MAG: response regulator transcription factor [Clostridia bacterium]|nr:response regulator transcription factor [Clostridia bacterium]
MPHILIVEDDRAIARIEKDYLELNGFQVTLAEDGETGRKLALQQPFDLILLDVMLPKLDGFTLLQHLREQLDVPILLVTARTEDLDKIRGLGLGADDYIEKPFSPSVLVARVRANLAQYARLKQGDKGRLLQSGSLKLDTAARRVFLEEQEIPLKNKEYELLLFFMRNAGMVFDRETLYERVWGLEAMGDSATVAVHINRLREKLGEGVIQTVRGAGYRFSGES